MRAPVVSVRRQPQASSSADGITGKNCPSDQTPNQLALVFLVRADLDQPIEALAVDQRLQPGADHDIGRGLAGLGVARRGSGAPARR
jgi:hypothetical protein